MGALIAVIRNELLHCSHCVVLSISNRKKGKMSAVLQQLLQFLLDIW